MRITWIFIIGVAAAVVYGLSAHAITGTWNFSLSFVIGTVVILSLSGFRSRPAKDPEVRVTHVPPGGERAPEVAPTAGESRDERAPAVAPTAVESRDGRAPAVAPAANVALPAVGLPETAAVDAAALWERARVMVHNVIPNLEEDAEYLDLVISAAEHGHVPALAKLGDYAFRRGAFVEAYFWTKLAHRRLELSDHADPQILKEISDMLRNIRREWSAQGQPPEYDNVYESFPEERGELGRAFLRLDAGMEVWHTREYIRRLSAKGNPDAALFVGT